jgi:hypothetical protein
VSEIAVTMMSISDLSKRWGCDRAFIWKHCRSGGIPSSRVGHKWFVPVWWVKEQERMDQKGTE